MRNFDQDSEKYYYYGNPDFKTEEVLKILGFYYDHNEFDEFGNLFEIWVKIKPNKN